MSSSTKEQTEVKLYASTLAKTMMAFVDAANTNDKAPETVQLDQPKMITPKNLKFKLSPQSTPDVPAPAPVKAPAPMDIDDDTKIHELANYNDDDDIRLPDPQPATKPSSSQKASTTTKVDKDGDAILESDDEAIVPAPKPSTSSKKPAATPESLDKKKTKKKPTKVPSVIEAAAEVDSEDDDDEEEGEETSADRAFVKPDTDGLSDEEEEKEDEDKKKKKAIHPFHAERLREMDAFAKTAKKASAAYENDQPKTAATSQLLKAVGMKKSAVKKITDLSADEDDEDDQDEEAKAAERQLVEDEARKMLGDEDVDDEEEEAKELARERKLAKEKKQQEEEEEEENSNEEEQEDKENEEDPMDLEEEDAETPKQALKKALMDASSGKSDETGKKSVRMGKAIELKKKVDDDIENDIASAKSLVMNASGKQELAGNVRKLAIDVSMSDDDDDDDEENVPPKKQTPPEPAKSDISKLKTEATIDRPRTVDTVVPQLKTILLKAKQRTSSVSSEVISAVIASVRHCIAAGTVSSKNSDKPTSKSVKDDVETLMDPFNAKIAELSAKLVTLCVPSSSPAQGEAKKKNLAILERLAKINLLCQDYSTRVISSVPAAKDCRCVLSHMHIKAGELMNYLVFLVTDLKFSNDPIGASPKPHTLRLPLALDLKFDVSYAVAPVQEVKRAEKKVVATVEEAAPKGNNAVAFFDEEEDAMDIDIPTDPKTRFLKGYDGLVIKDHEGFSFLAEMMFELARNPKEKACIAWRVPAGSTESVPNFDKATGLPAIRVEWVAFTLVGFWNHMFEVVTDIGKKSERYVRCVPNEPLYLDREALGKTNQSALKVASNFYNSIGSHFNTATFWDIHQLIAERIASANPANEHDAVNIAKTTSSPLVIMAQKKIPYTHADLKLQFARLVAPNKPEEPFTYNLGRLYFASRFMAQLLMPSPYYVEPSK